MWRIQSFCWNFCRQTNTDKGTKEDQILAKVYKRAMHGLAFLLIMLPVGFNFASTSVTSVTAAPLLCCWRRGANSLDIERLHCIFRWLPVFWWMRTIFILCYCCYVFCFCCFYIITVVTWVPWAGCMQTRDSHVDRNSKDICIRTCSFSQVGRCWCFIRQLFAVAQLLIFIFISVICSRHLRAPGVHNPFGDNLLKAFIF